MQELRSFARSGRISADTRIRRDQFQPASLDLRLGAKAYRLRSSFLPQGKTVMTAVRELGLYEIDLSKNGILERGHVYLIPLQESLALPPDVHGRTNPKSSTGRLDVFTRVIVDRHPRFEDIPHGFRGRLYLEVVSRSFTIHVKPGLSLNQLRLYRGTPGVTDEELTALIDRKKLLYNPDGTCVCSDRAVVRNGLFMSVDLSGQTGATVGFRARRRSGIVDLGRTGAHSASEYWEPIAAPGPGRSIILEPEEFYIFASRERIRVPPDYSAEMVEFDAGSGELRTHYAGFFDSGFGFGNGRKRGTPVVLEVRPHDVPFRVEDGQTFFRVIYERMLSRPEFSYGSGIGSHYHSQGLTLSKHFRMD